MSRYVERLDYSVVHLCRCCSAFCGLPIYVPDWLDDQLRATGNDFFCPAGHKQWFTKPKPPEPDPPDDPPDDPADADDPAPPPPPAPPSVDPPAPKQQSSKSAERLMLDGLAAVGCGSVNDLATHVGQDPKDVQAVLYRMLHRGRVERTRSTEARVSWGYEGSPPGNSYVYRVTKA